MADIEWQVHDSLSHLDELSDWFREVVTEALANLHLDDECLRRTRAVLVEGNTPDTIKVGIVFPGWMAEVPFPRAIHGAGEKGAAFVRQALARDVLRLNPLRRARGGPLVDERPGVDGEPLTDKWAFAVGDKVKGHGRGSWSTFWGHCRPHVETLRRRLAAAVGDGTSVKLDAKQADVTREALAYCVTLLGWAEEDLETMEEVIAKLEAIGARGSL